MIEQLATPETRRNAFGGVDTLTHRGWGFTHQPWSEVPLQSYSVLGVLDESGAFIGYPGTEEYAAISGTDYEEITAMPDVQAAAAAVQARHRAIRARQEVV